MWVGSPWWLSVLPPAFAASAKLEPAFFSFELTDASAAGGKRQPVSVPFRATLHQQRPPQPTPTGHTRTRPFQSPCTPHLVTEAEKRTKCSSLRCLPRVLGHTAQGKRAEPRALRPGQRPRPRGFGRPLAPAPGNPPAAAPEDPPSVRPASWPSWGGERRRGFGPAPARGQTPPALKKRALPPPPPRPPPATRAGRGVPGCKAETCAE
jgi:hypothetical protein